MKNLIKIEPIAVKDKNDVVKALTILEKVGIKRMTEEQKQNYLNDSSRTVDNNFMIQEADGGFRIQSHYLGFGITLESLEKQVNEILARIPDIAEKIEKIKQLNEELEKETIAIRERYEAEITATEDYLSIIEIKE